MRTMGAACLATMVLVGPSGAVEPCIPNASPSDHIVDSTAVQACLSKGGPVTLSPGRSPGYLIERGLKMSSNTTLTSTVGKATLAAHSTLGAEPILEVRGSNWHIADVVFDGKKYERDALGLCWSSDTRGSNLDVDGNDFRIEHLDTVNALCGTGLGVVGTNFEIAFVFSAYNGREVGEWPHAPYQWSDGMTVVYCENGHIHDNLFIDNTDFDLLFGGGPNCSVHHNEIHHQIRFAFGGFNIGHMNAGKRDSNGNNWKGNHYGSHFFQNRVSSKAGMLMYGLSVGSHPFTSETDTYVVYNAGGFVRNTSTGAQINLIVEGVVTGEIRENTLEQPQGNRSEYNNCRVSANYISGHTSFASQGGFTPMTIDNGVCQPY
jgi:hypothetical protein